MKRHPFFRHVPFFDYAFGMRRSKNIPAERGGVTREYDESTTGVRMVSESRLRAIIINFSKRLRRRSKIKRKQNRTQSRRNEK